MLSRGAHLCFPLFLGAVALLEQGRGLNPEYTYLNLQ